jgi:hypothetical protein
MRSRVAGSSPDAVDAEHARAACVRLEEVQQDADRGRLARAVAAEQRERFAGQNGEREVVEDWHAVEVSRDVVELDRGHDEALFEDGVVGNRICSSAPPTAERTSAAEKPR